MITIHYDFVDGTEISYGEGKIKKDNFTTNCISFFCFDYGDVTIVKKSGEYINTLELLENNSGEYTEKEIRFGHNLCKLLRANAFEWKMP